MRRIWIYIGMMALLWGCSLGDFLKPQTPFRDSVLVEPLNYEGVTAWAAHPDKVDKSAFTPPGIESHQPEAAVFFLHPTVWFSRSTWNAHFDPSPAREIVDEISMASQASAFNGCCRVFAPRYRQTTLGAFYAEQSEAQASFEIAYQDIQRAFAAFLKANPQGPIVLAGHSQGSMHLMRLLESIDRQPALRARLVAAYLPGMAIPLSWYQTQYTHLKPCTTPAQTQCISAWDTYRQGATTTGHHPLYYWQGDKLIRVDPDAPRQCTNPIHWQMNQTPSAKSAHQGAVAMHNAGKDFSFVGLLFSNNPLEVNITGLKAPRGNLLSAQCQGGFLRVPDLGPLNYPALETEPGNYHLLDYELFWLDIRQNVSQRLQTWQNQH